MVYRAPVMSFMFSSEVAASSGPAGPRRPSIPMSRQVCWVCLLRQIAAASNLSDARGWGPSS